MKRRITGLILVVVMLVLALASCAYSIAEDDMTKYASMSAEDKAAFEAILKALVIEDGEFTTDADIRKDKVIDKIYSILSGDVDTTKEDDRKTEGMPGAHDLVYYAYYCTAEIEGAIKYFYAANMKSSSATKVQLGTLAGKDLEKKLSEVFANYDFTDKAYESVTDGLAAEGDIAYVTYTYSYTETDAEGKDTVKSGTMTNDRIVIGAAVAEGATATTLADHLNGKAVNTSITKFTLKEEGKGDVEYSSVKINWISKGEEAGTFTDVTFDEKKSVSATDGKSHDLKGVELTYHVYPVYYYSVPEYTAENIINIVYAENISESYLIELFFGEDYAGLHVDHDGHSHDDDDFTEDEKKKMEELEEWLKAYKYTDGDKELTLSELCEKIAELQSKLATEEKDLDEVKEDLDTATSARDEAKEAVDTAGDSATQAQKDKLTQTEKALEDATEAYNDAKEDYDEAKKERDEKVALLLSINGKDGKPVTEQVIEGYKEYTYNSLQTSYNKEIKMNLATEIYYYLEKYIKVTATPEKAVKASYDQIFQNYQDEFYNGDADSKTSNYKKYNGNFKDFLIASVSTDMKTVKTYDEALAAIEAKAVSYVEPIVRIYYAANIFGVLENDKAFKEYQNDPEGNYYSLEYSYGENSARYAHQFDTLMNYFLESEEDDNGDITYKKVVFTFGDPVSSKEPEAEKK